MSSVRSSRRWVLAVCLGFAASWAWAEDPPKKKAEKTPALPASLAGFTDSGTFYLYKDQDRLVTMSFTWKPDGSFESNSELTLGGASVKESTAVTPDKDGRWEKIVIKSATGDTTVVRKGGVAERTYKGKTTTVEVKPNAVLFANFSPALMSLAVRTYDQDKGGKQKLPIFILPGVGVGGSLERKEEAERAVRGKDVKLRRYLYSLPGVDVDLWVEAASGRVLFADVPAQGAAFVREGYEDLRKSEEKDPLLSRPEHKVRVERNVGVPMRDGVKLSTDLYLPEKEGKHPVVLIRTPYKKEMNELKGTYFARRGYAVAIQNVRGRFGSPGEWEPLVNEPKDGHDAVEWLAARPWSTGKVGMIGGSYLGWVQWFAASQKPPHLVTIIPNVAPPDPFYNFPYEHGVFFLWGAIWWAEVVDSEATGDLSGAAMEKIMDRKYHQLLRGLPVVDLDVKLFGKKNPFWRKWIDHPTRDGYWDPVSFSDKLAGVKIPVFHQSGWFDGDGIGSKLNYLAMAKHGHPNQKLVLGPWGHTDEATRSIGGRDFGPEAVPDLNRAYLRWFDRYLKGVENGIDKEPLVSLFVMGSNKWAHGATYPLPGTRFDKWHLASGGKANTSKGDGRLTREVPAAGSDRYTYDPGDPTPEPRLYEETESKEAKASQAEQRKKREAYHEKLTAARKDILVYVTEPFAEPYTFAGPVSAVLYASTKAKDTDWFMRLMEVDEKGKLFPLGAGRVRARFRESVSAPKLVEPGKVVAYQIDLWQTGITIPKGRRLRVEVASAAFPMFSRNLNTGGHNEKETAYVSAEQTVYHGKKYPSHLLLPALPAWPAKKP